MGNTPRSRSKFSWKGNGCARLVTEKLRLTVIEIAFNCRYLHLPPSTRWSRSWTRAWRTADSRPSCSEQFQRPEMDSSGCNWSRQAGGQRSDWDLDWWTSDPKKIKLHIRLFFFFPHVLVPQDKLSWIKWLIRDDFSKKNSIGLGGRTQHKTKTFQSERLEARPRCPPSKIQPHSELWFDPLPPRQQYPWLPAAAEEKQDLFLSFWLSDLNRLVSVSGAQCFYFLSCSCVSHVWICKACFAFVFVQYFCANPLEIRFKK